MEVEPRNAKLYKCQYCCSCKNYQGKGTEGGKRVSLRHFFHEIVIFWSAENDAKTHFFHPYLLSPVIFATATVVAFVLLCNSTFNFHCYTQRKAMPTQKSAWK